MQHRRFALAMNLSITIAFLAACTSSGHQTTGRTITPSSPTAAGTTSAPSPSPSETDFAATDSRAATLVAADGSGNTLSAGISFGQIQTASTVADPVIHACDNLVAQVGSDLSRSQAVHITVQALISSSQPATVAISVSQADLASDYQPGDPGFLYFAYGSPNGSQCGNATADTANAAAPTWNNAAPGKSLSWTGWIIKPGTITPNDPSGAHSDLHALLIKPIISINAGAGIDYNYPRGSSNNPGEVLCPNPFGNPLPWVAVDITGATQRGCKAAN